LNTREYNELSIISEGVWREAVHVIFG